VRSNALELLTGRIGHFWPAAIAADGEFRWDVLHAAPEKIRESRLDAQFWQANIDPSDRYVQSLPGSSVHRLRPDESGYRNLFLAGDWVNSGINAGCIEAAALSGLQAANAVRGRPLGENVFGAGNGLSA
jgi:predicted NAD/FAD-dependent oxidoreductase